jgi:hypothetical protein
VAEERAVRKRRTPAPAIPGELGVIRIAIEAFVYGRWAAHQAFTGAEKAGENGKTGWVVTNIKTGLAIPPDVVNGLTRFEAEAVALALDEAGPLAEMLAAGDHDADRPTRRAIIDAIIAQALAEDPIANGLEECETCIGGGRIRDGETDALRPCLDCGGSGETVRANEVCS